jgi:hypothetical protein
VNSAGGVDRGGIAEAEQYATKFGGTLTKYA